MIKNVFSLYTQRHGFHLVDPSAMPLLTSISALTLTTGSVLFFHGYKGGLETTFFGMFSIFICMFLWWRDITREASFEGCHTGIVQLGLRYGVFLFIVSEIMFFFAFFWAFFSASLAPTIEIGNVWPPKGINSFNPLEIPLVNTAILLSSGVTITYSHHAIVAGRKLEAVWGLFLTILLAVIFTCFQAYEYINADFTISDSIFGSTFYLATGFRGLHVIIGTIFLFISLVRLSLNHFTTFHHLGFEASAFYWRFVDVVWLFLYVSIYFWGQ
jgi:cytochrome c oxidase subunit 3